MHSIFLLTAVKSSVPQFPFLLSYAHELSLATALGALLHTEAAHCWFPFYHEVPPTLMRFLSYVQKSASQQGTGTHLLCNSTLKGLETPPHQAPAEPWSGLQEMHSYWTANWVPPHLHRPFGQERREAAGKCSGSYAWLVLFSGKGLQNQPPPLPSTPKLHLSSQHPGVHKYFKMSRSLRWKNTACVLGNRWKRYGLGSQNINTLHMIELILDCPLQGSLRGTKLLRACSSGEAY